MPPMTNDFELLEDIERNFRVIKESDGGVATEFLRETCKLMMKLHGQFLDEIERDERRNRMPF